MTFLPFRKAEPDAPPSWRASILCSTLGLRSWLNLTCVMCCTHVAVAWERVVVFVLWGAGTEQEGDEEEGH